MILYLIVSDMTRQYKTMQTEMGLRIHQLETELERTNKLLGKDSNILWHVIYNQIKNNLIMKKKTDEAHSGS